MARRAGARAARIGLGATLPLPDGRLVGFGVAGALVPGLEPGALVTAWRVVDGEGGVLWEDSPLEVPGARPVVVCDVGRVVDEPTERAELAARTGAEAVDMESAALAASGRLIGVVRAIIDTPGERLGRLAFAVSSDGSANWQAVLRAFATEPATSASVALRARRAIGSLEGAARALASST